jgi:hypothetical protein
VASYSVNKRAVAHAWLIDAHQYVLDSDWDTHSQGRR